MRRRDLICGLLAVSAAGAAGVADVLPRPAIERKPGDGPRTAWPETGDRETRLGVVFRARTPRREIALTFDDGPDPRWTPRVLAMLRQQNAKGTFFVVGMRARRYPDLLRRIHDAGHDIGNHTYRHADLALLGHAAISAELHRTSDCIAEIIGERPTLMRPPWGHVDPVGLLATAEAKMTMILWSQHIRASDALSDSEACLKDAGAGSVVLAHDGGPTPNEALMRALPPVMSALRSQGFDLVSVSDLLTAT